MESPARKARNVVAKTAVQQVVGDVERIQDPAETDALRRVAQRMGINPDLLTSRLSEADVALELENFVVDLCFPKRRKALDVIAAENPLAYTDTATLSAKDIRRIEGYPTDYAFTEAPIEWLTKKNKGGTFTLTESLLQALRDLELQENESLEIYGSDKRGSGLVLIERSP